MLRWRKRRSVSRHCKYLFSKVFNGGVVVCSDFGNALVQGLGKEMMNRARIADGRLVITVARL